MAVDTTPTRTPDAPPSPPPPPRMGLLDHITATSLDADYAHVSERPGSPSPRRGRPGFLGLVVLAVFGVLVATSALQTSRTADESASSRATLITQVNARKAQVAAQRDTVARLTRSVNALQDTDLDATNEGRALRTRLERLELAAARVPVRGEGIRVVVDDAPGATTDKETVLDKDLQQLVNALWLVGAEAVSVNGHRLTNLTAIRQAGSAITVNFRSLERPYTVEAVGDRGQMGARLLDTEGGRTWLTLRASFGLRFDVSTVRSMTLPAGPARPLRFARQPERLK
jgi:uncharacterized protein YlxW (UPF0749 family)